MLIYDYRKKKIKKLKSKCPIQEVYAQLILRGEIRVERK